MIRHGLAVFGTAAALLLGAAGVGSVVHAETVTPPAAATQAYPPYGPGWGMMGGYVTTGGPTSTSQPPSQAWQAMWSACDQFMDSWGGPATPPSTAPGGSGS